ncbi:hypothetical protein DFH08DRAFT_953184 [Mycena albidolilacea]|uniref:C2H2-type domain-containing protein n=1 Tax=Mycena albidolilacea TaxID=1033008 RepID=A0AAD7AG91_9AGAR|nr:hypothetical protein DFH08DRAFT_953184 [Mycena albidolilacea]
MAFSPCSPLSSVLSTGALDMDNYFDFDAASCDPSPTFAAMGSDSPQAFGKTQLSMDFVQSILEMLVCQRDDTHNNPHRIRTMDVNDIFSGTGPCNDQTVGLPTTQWSPQACDWSDSESCSSAPGSPSSFLSTLSPPHTPISFHGADSDKDDCINSSNGPSRASISYAAGISNKLATSSFFPPPRPSVTIPSPPSSIFVHAPRPVLSRDFTIVGGLEQIVQPPAAVEREEFVKQESDMPYRLELPPPIAQPQLIHLKFLDLLPRTPSPCERKGPQHRIGKKKPGKGGKTTHRCLLPHCGSTLTRLPDLLRHNKFKHKHPSLVDIFGCTDERERQWCLGCLTVLSREDSRRRHEKSCTYYADYMQAKVQNTMFLPLPEIYAESGAHCRLWCSHCYDVFPSPTIRHQHEIPCVPPLLDPKTYFPKAAPLR